MWTPAAAHQHVALPNVKLPPFWPKDPNSWFTLAESTFSRHNVVDSRLRFDLVLPALPEEVIEQVRGVLRVVNTLDRPYVALKARLLQLLIPQAAGGQLRGAPTCCWRRAPRSSSCSWGRGPRWWAETGWSPTQGKRHLQPLSLHAGGDPPGEEEDLLHNFRRSPGSYVAGTWNLRYNIVINFRRVSV